VRVYNDPVTRARLFVDLGLDRNNRTFQLYVDGLNSPPSPNTITFNGGLISGTGYGARTEVYALPPGSPATYRIVVINTFIGLIGQVNVGTPATRPSVTIICPLGFGIPTPLTLAPAPLAHNNGHFNTTAFARNDVVLYTVVLDAFGTAYNVRTVELAERATVVPTAVSGRNNFSVGTTTYFYSLMSDPASRVSQGNVTGRNEMIVFFDNYNNVIRVQNATPDVPNIAVVLATRSSAPWDSQAPIFEAQLLLADGTTTIVRTSNGATGTGLPLFTLVTTTSIGGGITQLNEAGEYEPGSTVAITRNRPLVSLSDPGDFMADETTLFILWNGVSHEIYRGISAVPTLTGGDTSFYTGGGLIPRTIYIRSVAVTIAPTQVTFVASRTALDAAEAAGDASFWRYQAVVGGQADVNRQFDTFPALFTTSNGFYVGFSTANGLITGSTALTATTSSITHLGRGVTGATVTSLEQGNFVDFNNAAPDRVMFTDNTTIFHVFPNGDIVNYTGTMRDQGLFNPASVVYYYATNNILTAVFIIQ
jgi:hypothetical protein